MSELTKEWLLKTIAELEEERDAVPGVVNEDAANALAAMKLALASLEAVPVAYMTYKGYLLHAADPKLAEYSEPTPLYDAPPAPVALPSGYSDFEEIWSSSTHPLTQDDEMKDFAWDIWNACRAAMLQGAEPVTTDYKLPDGCCVMPLKLTAENGAKGALSGEFHVTNRIVCQSCAGEGCEDCNDEGGWDAEIPVSWDTIKRIHGAAVEACSLPAAPQQEDK